MNSEERHERRYQRRKAKREAKKRLFQAEYGSYEKVFTFEHLYKAYHGCIKGVGWKASTQRYKARAMLNLAETQESLMMDSFKSRGFHEFSIFERGKPREIKSVHISERVVQRCLCDYSLVLMFGQKFIYDNGACMKGKGIDFAINRFVCHLQRHYRKYGCEGYVLTFDFSKYFDRINHERLKAMVDDCYQDKRLSKLIKQLIDDFGGEAGLGLGSQISQVSALMYPNILDHFIKETLRIKGYARYMDDGYAIHPDKAYLQYCLKEIRSVCESLGIVLNMKKTQIVKLSRGVSFLKHRFILTETGKVLKLPAKGGVVKMRRKLKKFREKLDAGQMSFDDVKASYASWCGHLAHCNAYMTRKSMDGLFYRLFAKEVKMSAGIPKITVENICRACGKGPCDAPCELWYRCLEGEEIKAEELSDGG